MPKPFSDADRDRIRDRLVAVGKILINRGGFRSLTIAQVASQAGIAKGSFYSFFPSREDFLLSVLESWEGEFRGKLLEELALPGLSVRTRWQRFFQGVLTLLDREPGLATMNSREVGFLMERLPPERLAAHQAEDRRAFDEALGRLLEGGVLAQADAAAFPGVMMILFSLVVSRDLFPTGTWGPSSNLLTEALASRFATKAEASHG